MTIRREPPKALAVALGASGYVAGELLRWIALHPGMELGAAVSSSHAGEPLAETFPNLRAAFPDERFLAPAALPRALRRAAGEAERVVAFSAAPHTRSAPQIRDLLEAAERLGIRVPVVDLSADFRHPDPDVYEAIYGVPHPAPDLLPGFVCGLPEQISGTPSLRIAHPGCFATAVALAAAPLRRAGVIGAEIQVAAITGSTGSGGAPRPNTHHPERHANLFAYKPLTHRHAPEMENLIGAAAGEPTRVHFVPHSGPFARGIHATLFASRRNGGEVEATLAACYRDRPLIRVSDAPPRLKEVVGSASAVVGGCAEGATAVAFAALDNLGKGAASGGMQWMNRILGLPDETGLTAPAASWL